MIDMADTVEFDEARHEYRVEGEVVPSVTQVLSDLSTIKRLDPVVLAAKGELGRRVHKAIFYFNDDDLDVPSLPEDLQPYVAAWQRFCSDFNYKPLLNERIVWSPRWRYAGTLDTFGKWAGGNLINRTHVVLDVKTGAEDPVHAPQTAAYSAPLHEMGVIPIDIMPSRAAVYLQANGFYVIDHFFDPGDWSLFVAALHCYRFKRRHGLL